MIFSEFGFTEVVEEGLRAMGFETPTPIQMEAIPPLMEGKDMIGVAQTGTGKTAAYLLPIIDDIEKKPVEGLTTIILSPTRELALQIDQQLEGFAYYTYANSYAIYGGGDGTSFDQERKALTKGTNIIVATPGRLISHLNLGYIDFTDFRHFVLDEADRMLDMGFFDDIMRIINKLPKERQTLLFSATMPGRIRQLATNILNNPAQVNIAISKPNEGILQGAYMTYAHQKVALIERLLTDKRKDYQSVLIFSSTKKNVKEVTRALQKLNIDASSISSDLSQEERERVMLDFKNRKIQILVATDIVARGIDIDGISLVLNYDVPNDAEDYVHRIGRTARGESTGVGLTLIAPEEAGKFSRIEQLIETVVPKIPLPPEIGEGPEYRPGRRLAGKQGNHKAHSSGKTKSHGANKKRRFDDKGNKGKASSSKGGNYKGKRSNPNKKQG